MRNPALLALLCICAGVSIADAQTVTPTTAPRPVYRAPEWQWGPAASALIMLAGAIAIVRGMRKP